MAKLTAEQKADIINKYKSGDKEGAIAATKEIANQAQTPTPKNTSRDQGSGNYKYNEATGYYEKEGTERASSTYTPAKQETTTTTPTTPTTPTPKAEETVVSTDSEIKQEGRLKPLTQEYYNQTSDEAINKIKDNLNTYKQTNPEYFRTYEDFKKNFSYDARNEEQKNALDTWYRGYEDGLWLAATPTADLYTQYQDGNLSANQLESLRISNPTKYAELQTQINKGNIIAAYDDDKSGTTTGTSIQDMAYQMMVQTFNQFMNGDNTSGASQFFRDYEDKMNDPEMLGLSDKCTEVQEEMENIQSDLDSIKKSVEAEYEGTGASRAKINAIISDRSYDLQLQLRTLNSEYNKYATQYNNRMNQYQNEFSLQLQEYQIQQQSRQQQMQELGFAMDLMNFETNEQKAQREWDYWVKQQEYTNGNINSKDYDTRYKAALKSVQNLLSQYEGIPMQRSAEQMAQDVLKAIDNGSDLGTELTKINKQIQNKPEYKKLYNDTYGTSDKGFGKTVTIGDTDYVEYNGKLYTSEEFNKEFGGQKKSYNVVSEDVLETYGGFFKDAKNHEGKYGGQCGKYVNNYLEKIGVGRYYDDELTTKLNSVNSDNAKKGTIAVFDYGHKSSDGINHGHVAIVTEVLPNGNFLVMDSNYNGDGIIQIREIDPNSASLKGFFDPSLSPEGMVTSTSTSTTTDTKVDTNSDTTVTTSTATIGNLTPSQFDDYVKLYIDGEVSYSEVKAAYGDEGLAKVTERAAQLRQGGYEKSTKITDPNKQANMEQKLRSEYDKAVSDAQETIDWVNKMQEAYNLIDTDKNAASQAIVIAYNKILDPGSVVREGEYARSAEGQSKLKQIQAKLEQFVSGGAGLTKDEIASLINVAQTFSENAKKVQKDAADRTMVSIEKYGLTPEAVLPLSALNQPNSNKENTSSSRKGKNIANMNYSSSNNTTGNSMEGTNFYQTYANTAPSNTTVYNVDGYEVTRP